MNEPARIFRGADQDMVKPDVFARTAMTQLREERDWSYSELGRRLGTTPTQVRKMENGDLNISLTWMFRLARAFDVKMSAFLPPDEIDIAIDPLTMDVLDVCRGLGSEERRILLTAAREMTALARRLGEGDEGPRLRGDNAVAQRFAEHWQEWSPEQRRRVVRLVEAAEDLADPPPKR